MFRGVEPRICYRFRDISSQNFDFSSFDLDRANPSAQGHQNGRRRTIHLGLPYPKNFSPNFFTFWHFGANPWVKVHQKGEDLADSEIYQHAKLHRSAPTHALDIRYQNSCGRTNRKTKKTNSNRYIPNMPIGMWG